MKRKYLSFIFFYSFLLSVSLNAAVESSSSLNQKGMEELRSNHPDKAAEYFAQAISIDPKQKHYHNNLAAAYMRLGEYAKAEEHLKISLELDGGYARALSNMSVTLFHLGRYSESYHYYLLTKKADSAYSEKRFEKKRVSSYIKKLSEGKPEDEDLKRIKDYMESDAGE
ncbi:MAG: hypothetical protein CVV49_09375 [Spirochaetae bacterium HGW-Spirochaetae-5]|nr:MAG: hypothetical protein CVV49_09375 [Spirochaetae bacterium HGW-Spirochaetae-5]